MPRHVVSLLAVLLAAPLASTVAQQPTVIDSTKPSSADSAATVPSWRRLPLDELRAMVRDSLAARVRDTLALRHFVVRLSGSRVACPMPVFVPAPGAAIPMPTVRPDRHATVPMPTDSTACANPLYRPPRQ